MLTTEIGSQKWRLNNLYHIIDEHGSDVLFKMRPQQEKFFDEFWYFNIILKARQLGFTTFIDIMGLDYTIFKPNFTTVIIAETKEKAADIFSAKVVHPYEQLPKELRDWCPIVAHSADGELHFKNGSCIKVMVSARSGTCQFLHVSEFGPVCAKSPRKAEEILTGSFPAVHAGSFCFVESTAMGNSGHFYDMVQRAKSKQLQGRSLDKRDFKLHFFPWHEDKKYVADPRSVVISARLEQYFDKLYNSYGIELSEQQMAWYAIQEDIYHDKIKQEYPSYVDEAFEVVQDGSYYGRAFQKIYAENRICKLPYDPALLVYTSWDLGMSDETSVWFFQFFGKEIRVIDFYSNNGEGLPHYINVLRSKDYRYARHFAPHDIAVRELSTGVSRLETARKLGCEFDRIPTNVDLMGGIENVREMLGYCYFDEAKTAEGRKALEAYKKEWDDKHGCYKSHPLHDWASHPADSFRTMAQAWKMGLVATRSDRSATKVTGGLQRL
ncbi:MAG: terminase [Lentisphaeria bacterium]|nr:terminase [Lentisphaeria bacterium]